jgi:hypothetical protein
MATLPQAPTSADFPDRECIEEALGFWQSRVGRIKAIAARASVAQRGTSEAPADKDA